MDKAGGGSWKLDIFMDVICVSSLLGSMCIVFINFPARDIKHFEMLDFWSNQFPIKSKKLGQKLKYLKNKMSF